MNKKKFDISKEDFNRVKTMAETGTFPNGSDDYIGSITQGAVKCDFVVIEEEDFADESYRYGEKYAIDANYFLLGKDTGYADRDGVPYDCVTGFYSKAFQPGITYDQFMENLAKEFDENLTDELVAGTKNPELTWDTEEEEL